MRHKVKQKFNGECNAEVPPSTGACHFQCGRRIVLAFESEAESHNKELRSHSRPPLKCKWCFQVLIYANICRHCQ